MATKKTASSAKKTKAKTSSRTTKVTTVKAVSSTRTASTLFGVKLHRWPLLGAGIAEFIGTFLLAAAVITGQGQPIVALFALVGVVLAVGALSGAHVNPALTIAAAITRKITAARASVYIVAQVLGAMLALVVLTSFFDQAPEVSSQAAAFGQSTPQIFKAAAIPEAKEVAVLFAEMLGAAIFAFGVATAWRQKETISGAFGIGISLFLGLLVAGTATNAVGASTILNPAVAVALQAVSFETIWPFAVYLFGASLGAVVGFIVNDLLQVESDGGKG